MATIAILGAESAIGCYGLDRQVDRRSNQGSLSPGAVEQSTASRTACGRPPLAKASGLFGPAGRPKIGREVRRLEQAIVNKMVADSFAVGTAVLGRPRPVLSRSA